MPFLGESFAVRSSGSRGFTLTEPLTYQGSTEAFCIPAGFPTDFATVPRVFTWLIPTYGVYTRAAVLHDFLCVEAHAGRFSRRDADGIFRRVLRELGVGRARRRIMWAGVRAGGRFSETTPLELAQVAAIGVLAVVFLAIPIAVVAVWSALFWIIERG